ncbi:hypothetical protein L1275_002466 [Flavobacterium sp. HSC-61S13]|nr:hypothetical protein [Flavobacterium sp. HSC-61S13]
MKDKISATANVLRITYYATKLWMLFKEIL